MSTEKATGPAKDLIWAAMFCFVVGLMTVLVSALVFLFYWDTILSEAGDPSTDPAVGEDMDLLRIWMFWLVPALGMVFLLVGCFIWKCHRQFKALRRANEGNGAPGGQS